MIPVAATQQRVIAAIAWIEETFRPRETSSAELMYEAMPSQSFGTLPVVYEPFDAGRRSHWVDRGSILDFAEVAGTGTVLDFGPGDGWPSLVLAPYVDRVIGIDASRRRVEVCTANAARLGVANARFLHASPGQPLPLDDASVDAVIASASVEQSPHPRETLSEFFRVLRPGGRVRIWYESLRAYRGGQEADVLLWASDAATTVLMVTHRRIARREALHVAIHLRAPLDVVQAALAGPDSVSSDAPAAPSPGGSAPDGVPWVLVSVPVESLTVERLRRLQPLAAGALRTRLAHPDCRTLCRWLREAGFEEVTPTHWGGAVAARLFDNLPPPSRPTTVEGVDDLLRPYVRVATGLEAPVSLDPPVSARRTALPWG